MRVGIGLEIDSTLGWLSPVVAKLDHALKSFFGDREYGSGVQNLFIGLILTDPQLDKLHPVRKLKFSKVKRLQIPGSISQLENVVEYDIKPDFHLIASMDAEGAQQFLGTELLASVDILERKQERFVDFDFPKFRDDMKTCLRRCIEFNRFG